MSCISFCQPNSAIEKDSESTEIMIDVFKMLQNALNNSNQDELEAFQKNIWNKSMKFSSDYFNCFIDFVNKSNPMSFIESKEISIMDKVAFCTRFMLRESFEKQLHEFISQGIAEGDISTIVIPDSAHLKYEDDVFEII